MIEKELVNQYIQQQNSNLDQNLIKHLNCLITEFKQSANLADIKKIVDAISNDCKSNVSDPLILAIDESLINSLLDK